MIWFVFFTVIWIILLSNEFKAKQLKQRKSGNLNIIALHDENTTLYDQDESRGRRTEQSLLEALMQTHTHAHTCSIQMSTAIC